MLKTGIAARNFDYCMKVLDENYSDWDTIYYTILQTLIELDKVKSSKYSQSDLQEYGKYWNVQDIYYMFENTYDALKQSRSRTTDIQNDIVYLLSLISLSPIPALEVLS